MQGPISFYRDGELVPRGTIGRTSSLIGLNTSLEYVQRFGDERRFTARLEILNPLNQPHVREVNQIAETPLGTPSPEYLLPTRYQGLRVARLHVSMDF